MPTVCVKCQAKFQIKKMSILVIETTGTEPKPLRVWSADLFSCPICNAEILSQFGHEPIIESHEDGFEKFIAEINPNLRYVLYSPEYLASNIRHDTRYVRNYGSVSKTRV